MAASRRKTPSKPTKSKEKFIVVELDGDGDPSGFTTAMSFKTQQEAEQYVIDYEPEEGEEIAVCKVVSVGCPPEPKPRMIFKPY